MKSILIAGVLVLTGGAFYSALAYKSDEIERDVSQRTAQALADAGAQNVDLQVDGRHVTLAGVVASDAAEMTYLAAAETTHGALGPIDGLTQQQGNGGFLTVIKSPEGIALRGTVPTEQARDDLIALAEELDGGPVDNALEIAGPAADWQEELPFGLTQLAQLSTGTLTASASGFALSGTGQGDLAPVTTALADREGWQNFVAPAPVVGTVSEELNTLRADISDRDARITGLESDLADLTQDSTGGLAALQQRLGDADGQVADLTAANTELTAQLDTATGERDAMAGQVTGLEEQLNEARDTLDTRTGEVTGLRTNVAGLTATIASLETAGDGTARIAELDGQLADGRAEIAELTATNTELTQQLDTATGELDTMAGQVAGLEEQLGDARDTINTRTDEVTGLRTDVAGLTSTIAALETAGDGTARIAELEREASAARQTAQDQIVSLNGEIETRDTTIAALTAELDTEQAEVARLLQDQSATDNTAPDADTGQLQSQISALETTVSAREATIVELLSQGAITGDVATQCAARANNVLANSGISFTSGTARLTANSVGLLERVTGIVLACSTGDMVVEVGGHTDAQGSEADNQSLSEARAQAVVDFMVGRGVPIDGLQAAGYGESTPIASNDTDAGRAQNRRITFDWQAR